MLNLNQNVAGATLLALGNSAPDFFTSFASVASNKRNYVPDVIGSANFILFVVLGIIITTSEFTVQPMHFLRDVLFLILGILFVDYKLFNRQIKPIDTLCKYVNLKIVIAAKLRKVLQNSVEKFSTIYS